MAKEIIEQTGHHTQNDLANNTLDTCLDAIKQNLSVYSEHLKRYKARNSKK